MTNADSTLIETRDKKATQGTDKRVAECFRGSTWFIEYVHMACFNRYGPCVINHHKPALVNDSWHLDPFSSPKSKKYYDGEYTTRIDTRKSPAHWRNCLATCTQCFCEGISLPEGRVCAAKGTLLNPLLRTLGAFQMTTRCPQG